MQRNILRKYLLFTQQAEAAESKDFTTGEEVKRDKFASMLLLSAMSNLIIL